MCVSLIPGRVAMESGDAGSDVEARRFTVKRWRGRAPSGSPPQPAGVLSEGELDALVGNAVLGADLALDVQLPWESGVMEEIFGAQNRSVPQLRHEACRVVEESESRDVRSRAAFKAPGRSPLFQDIVKTKCMATNSEIFERKLSQAMEVWYTIEALATEESFVLGGDSGRADFARSRLLDLCGARSPSTILKRGRSMLRYVRWFRQSLFDGYAVPVSGWKTEAYFDHLSSEASRPSAFSSFIEALNFAVHVLGFQSEPEYVTRAVLGRLARIQLQRNPKKQARVLTVAEITALERSLEDESIDIKDRYASGVFLFNLYSRSRWSDIHAVSDFLADINYEGGINGYLEFGTRSHKTSRIVASRGLTMPLVAPVWGIGEKPWGISFIKVAKEAGVDLLALRGDPLLPAPILTGWGRRSLTSSEAKAWLTAPLHAADPDGEHEVSSHGLKATLLSWCAKAGLGDFTRAVLGHHSTGKNSVETYSRDLLAAPLRELDEVIRRVRVGVFLPDLTRSGHVRADELRQDPRDAYTAQQRRPTTPRLRRRVGVHPLRIHPRARRPAAVKSHLMMDATMPHWGQPEILSSSRGIRRTQRCISTAAPRLSISELQEAPGTVRNVGWC